MVGTELGGMRRERENPTWFLGRSAFCVYMGCLLEFRARIKHTQCWGREIRSGGSVRSRRHGKEGRGGRRQCSMTELGMRLKDWVWGSRVRGAYLQSAHLIPQQDSSLLSYPLQKSSRTFQAVCPLSFQLMAHILWNFYPQLLCIGSYYCASLETFSPQKHFNPPSL